MRKGAGRRDEDIGRKEGLHSFIFLKRMALYWPLPAHELTCRLG